MAIANETIIQKMIEELQAAKQQENQDKLIKHMEHVRLLCDLFLTDKNSSPRVNTSNHEISPEEMKAMLGEAKPAEVKQPSFKKTTTLDEDDANGNSIFDF